MERNNSLSKDRVVGSSGVSIGTHLCLESLFYSKLDLYDHERSFDKVNADVYDYHIFNLYTIVRNILNSFAETDKILLITQKSFPSLLKEEINLLSNLYTGVKCKPVIFYPNYNKLYKGYNRLKKEVNTATYNLQIVIDGFLRSLDKNVGIDCVNDKKSYKLNKLEGRNLITTHISLDLFNKGNLTLLESHTGKLIPKQKFNLRYRDFGNVKFDYLPWDEMIYYILGDHVFVKGLPVKYKKQLVDISRQYNWNIKTTDFLMRNTLRRDSLLSFYVNTFTPFY